MREGTKTEHGNRSRSNGGTFARIHALIRKTRRGSVATYGEIAAAANVSVRTVVWALRNCPSDIPWHRVVGKDGTIVLARRSPLLAAEQSARLASEGWRVNGWKIDKPAASKPRKNRPASNMR